MDAGKTGQLPQALWDALLAARGTAPQGGGAAADDTVELPRPAPALPTVTLTGANLEQRVGIAPLLPRSGYTVNLSPAAVAASYAALPTLPTASSPTTAKPAPSPTRAAAQGTPARPEAANDRIAAARVALRSDEALLAANDAEVPPGAPRAATPAVLTSASNVNARAEPAPRGNPADVTRAMPFELGPRGLPGAATSIAMATAPVVADAMRPAPGPGSPAPRESGTPGETTAAAPQSARAPVDRIELSTNDGLLVASNAAPRSAAASDAAPPAVALPLPGGAPRGDVHPAYMPLSTFAAAGHAAAAVAAEEAKAALRLSHRPAPELVQQLLIPNDAPRPPAPDFYRLVVATLVLGVLLYMVL